MHAHTDAHSRTHIRTHTLTHAYQDSATPTPRPRRALAQCLCPLPPGTTANEVCERISEKFGAQMGLWLLQRRVSSTQPEAPAEPALSPPGGDQEQHARPPVGDAGNQSLERESQPEQQSEGASERGPEPHVTRVMSRGPKDAEKELENNPPEVVKVQDANNNPEGPGTKVPEGDPENQDEAVRKSQIQEGTPLPVSRADDVPAPEALQTEGANEGLDTVDSPKVSGSRSTTDEVTVPDRKQLKLPVFKNDAKQYGMEDLEETPEEPKEKPEKPRPPVTKPQLPGNKPKLPGNKPKLPGNKPQLPPNKPRLPGNKPKLPGPRPRNEPTASAPAATKVLEDQPDDTKEPQTNIRETPTQETPRHDPESGTRSDDHVTEADPDKRVQEEASDVKNQTQDTEHEQEEKAEMCSGDKPEAEKPEVSPPEVTKEREAAPEQARASVSEELVIPDRKTLKLPGALSPKPEVQHQPVEKATEPEVQSASPVSDQAADDVISVPERKTLKLPGLPRRSAEVAPPAAPPAKPEAEADQSARPGFDEVEGELYETIKDSKHPLVAGIQYHVVHFTPSDIFIFS